MKPQLFAVISRIITRSTRAGVLKDRTSKNLMGELQKGNVHNVWDEIESKFLESNTYGIWNSCVVNGIPYFWIHNDVIPFPLQMLALECEYLDSDVYDVLEIREYIAKKASGLVNEEISPPLHFFRFVNWEEGDWLKLLQRINWNQRERPFIEKWKWSKKRGLACLSNDGRINVHYKLPIIRAFHYWMSSCHKDGMDMSEKQTSVLYALSKENRSEEFSLDTVFSQDELIFLCPITILYGCKVS